MPKLTVNHIVRRMYAEEKELLKQWRKDHTVAEFLFTWERWKKWEEAPPFVVLAGGDMLAGFHGVSHTKSGYINSAAQFVAPEHRGKGLAGAMINALIMEGVQAGLSRLRFRTPIGGDGEACWRGFGVIPFGKTEKEHWYDLSLTGAGLISNAAQLVTLAKLACEIPTTDKRTLGHYRKSKVVPLLRRWQEVLG